MALFKISKGDSRNLPDDLVEGYAYVTTDENKFYVDIDDETRISLNATVADVAKRIYKDPTDATKGQAAFTDLQTKLSGGSTQCVGFDAEGKAIARDFPDTKFISGEPVSNVKIDEDIAKGNFVYIYLVDNEYHAKLAIDTIDASEYYIGFITEEARKGTYVNTIEKLMLGTPNFYDNILIVGNYLFLSAGEIITQTTVALGNSFAISDDTAVIVGTGSGDIIDHVMVM